MLLPTIQSFKLKPRKKIKLAAALLDIFNSGQLVLLGDLRQLDDRFYPLVSWNRERYQQDSTAPHYGRVSLPLDAPGVELIRKYILYRVGITSRIHEVRVTQSDKTKFIAYDNFYWETTLISAEVGEQTVKNLMDQQAIWSYEPVNFSIAENTV